jgi:hypothetical protein
MWSDRRLPLLGQTIFNGVTPQATFDLARYPNIFGLRDLTLEGRKISRLLTLKNLWLFNLPACSPEANAGADDGRGLHLSILCHVTALLWLIDTEAAMKSREDQLTVVAEKCVAIVECEEVAFLRHFAMRLQSRRSSTSSAVAEVTVRGRPACSLPRLHAGGRQPLVHALPCNVAARSLTALLRAFSSRFVSFFAGEMSLPALLDTET